MHIEFQHITTAFEHSVKKMQEDLQYLADSGNVSQGFISKQNFIIKNLIKYQHYSLQYIEFLEKENAHLQIQRRNKIEELHDRIISFEAICILHGIIDFPYWLSKTKEILIEEAVSAKHHYGIHLPTEWQEKIAALPENQRKELKALLFKEDHAEIKKLYNELSEKKRSILSKIEGLPEFLQHQILSVLKLTDSNGTRTQRDKSNQR